MKTIQSNKSEPNDRRDMDYINHTVFIELLTKVKKLEHINQMLHYEIDVLEEQREKSNKKCRFFKFICCK